MNKGQCKVCKRKFKEGDELIPVLRYVENERRGDFVNSQPHRYVYAYHVKILSG